MRPVAPEQEDIIVERKAQNNGKGCHGRLRNSKAWRSESFKQKEMVLFKMSSRGLEETLVTCGTRP